ncbi:MAG: penicillin-binding protein 2 [Flavobacteriaceae bacterium]|nr:penicillin-binding protein 2 [Flavobacteriaceae bacterium]
MPRKSLLYFLIILVGTIFIVRLLYLQVIDNTYKENPLNNSAVTIKYAYPDRGYIYDRNGKLLVANQSSYDVMIIPKDVEPLDTLEFCNLLKITKEEFIKKYIRTKNYSPRIPSIFLSQLSKEDYAYLQEKMYKYKGFYIQKRFLRKYPLNTSANVLGYISEVNNKTLKENKYYKLGDLVGLMGVEKQYENELRGVKGVNYIKKNRFNKEIGTYKDGIYDTLPIPGKDISLTIDLDLQLYTEKLLYNKRGGIVAIEPSTGEILTLVSTPGYNPNMLVGRDRSKNSVLLFNDTITKPMLDKSLQAQYPPGSPFKLINALIGLQENVITPETPFYCYHGYKYGGRKMACHCGIVGSPIRMNVGIYRSCNSYFSNVYRRTIEKYDTPTEGMNVWSNHVKSFGLGNYLGYDLPSGQKGLIPDSNTYKRIYPNGGWRAITTISNAIGQGEVLTTPIQLANMTAAIANRGFYYTPHILKKIGDSTVTNEKYTKPKYTSIDAKYFEPVIEGMFNVFEIGTARFSKIDNIEICGKTGTSENFKRINGKKVQFTDHSIFVAFAPKDNPKIAIAVFIENGYWGSRWAAPIASLMIEKYINGSIGSSIQRQNIEQKMLTQGLEEEYKKQLDSENYIAKKEK